MPEMYVVRAMPPQALLVFSSLPQVPHPVSRQKVAAYAVGLEAVARAWAKRWTR